ncbi:MULTISPECIES: M28 family peptidase [unclassified Polaribacter]|uniref:M28 family peptidase n=1 Tax=unclassified Polaribacter TaxID=196858 RepID=UPI0011BE13C6|nr:MULTISPECIES: M28 family peptidase [unclassified Polaribacter]TXD53548.1 M28 family peptidase [Polaribacter sp. IC063]TXD58620.1 M28 family peptidase [Polaribacter sp. IC066]
MKRVSSILSMLIILGVIYWSFSDLTPPLPKEKTTLNTDFSLENALHHLKNISQKAHYVGSEEHKNVQNYIVKELQKLGFETEIQTETAFQKKWFSATTTENILARLPGSENGKALMLLTHYDSNMHSSLGASDAGSGVVTILEGIRAYLAKNETPKNDLIILISDAEEIGLLGAQAFVNEHSWTADIGLVLNFEARGSGGPSYMLMETNGKNSKLLTEFLATQPNFPAANSLMYSVYKKLPNDTDLTVFREDADINGFNFAFIGDHFDYHTAQDSYERLDRETLLHQADYLTTSLNYFANSDLENLNSDEDFVYINFPFTNLLTYPFSYVNTMFIIASILFLVLLFFGFSLNRITIKGVFIGFVPFLISIILCGGISFYGWKLLQIIHPAYVDILQGFTYNGYVYITAFVFLNLWVLLKTYKYFKKQDKTTDLLVAPIFIWLLVNALICIYLKGSGFFIIPVFAALLILAIAIFMNLQDRSKRILFTILSIPTIYMFAPLIKMFPVGLGLKNLFISGIIIALIFGLMILTFDHKKSNWILKFCGFFSIIFFGYATYTSGFSIDHKKPNSLVYIQNPDDQTAFFATYNTTFDAYTAQIFKDTITKGSISNAETKSKYNTTFKHYQQTEYKNIISSAISIEMDTIIERKRFLELVITPKRKVNKLEFITKNPLTLNQFKINDALVLNGKSYTVDKGTFLSYTIANTDDELTLSFTVDAHQPLDIILNEISYDLLTNPNFSINPRSEEMMPMPFVTNDAIIISKKLPF